MQGQRLLLIQKSCPRKKGKSTEKLSEIDSRYRRGELEEEVIDAYDTSVKRLRAFTDKEFAKKLEEKLKKRV